MSGKKIDEGEIMSVKRFDISTVRYMNIDSNGFLRGDGVVTRIGVFTYANPDGTLRKELRHPDDILRVDSLNTMSMIPITDGHPQDMISPENAKRLSVGFVGENIRPDGSHIIAPVVITDANTINKVQGGVKSLSLGYAVDLIKEDGEYDGMRYDFRQTNVRYNHLAIVNTARAGNGAKLKFDGFNMDAEDAVLVEDAIINNKDIFTPEDIDWDEYADPEYLNDVQNCMTVKKREDRTAALRKSLRALGKRKEINRQRIKSGEKPLLEGKPVSLSSFIEKTSATKTTVKNIKKGDSADNIFLKQFTGGKGMDDVFRIDGISYPCSPEVVNFINKLQVKHDALEKELDGKLSEVDTLRKDKDTISAERDTAIDKIKKLEGQNHSDEINKLVKERVDIMNVAEKVIPNGVIKIDGKDVKLDSADNISIKKAVISSQSSDVNFDGKSEDYINARFDTVVEGIVKSGITSQKKVTIPQGNGGSSDRIDADEARQKMIKEMKEAHAAK